MNTILSSFHNGKGCNHTSSQKATYLGIYGYGMLISGNGKQNSTELGTSSMTSKTPHLPPRKLLILNGPPSSGKDTIANILYKHYDCRRFKFSNPLKKALVSLFELDVDWMTLEKTKDLSTNRFFGMTFREAQIWLSEEVMKPKFGPDIFGYLMLRQLYSPYRSNGPFDVISDTGFMSEVDCVYQNLPPKSVYLLRIHRNDCTFSNDSRGYLEHPKINSDDFYNTLPLALLPKLICTVVHKFLELGDPTPAIVSRDYTSEEIDLLEKCR
jgi:hypothetical protein